MKEKHTNSKFPWTLAQLKDILKRHGKSCFHFEEFIVKTNFGNYNVSTILFNTKNYDEFLTIMTKIIKNGKYSALLTIKQQKKYLSKTLDNYIRTKLFGEPFDPYIDNNFQVLKIAKAGIIEHIIKNVSQMIYGISIEKLIKIIKSLKETITEQEKTIVQQDEKIMHLYQDLAELHSENSILKRNLAEIEEEKLQIKAQTKIEREQKIDEILKITKNIEGYINTQTKC